MPARDRIHSSLSLGRSARDTRGIIVLGPLIVFLGVLIVMVVAGKLLYRDPRPPYVDHAGPELQYVVYPAEVYSADRVVMRLQPGDSVWAARLDNGTAAVFRSRTAKVALGVTSGLLVPGRVVPPRRTAR